MLELLQIWNTQASSGAVAVDQAQSTPPNITVDLHPSRPEARGMAAPPTYEKIICRLQSDPTFQEIRDLGGEVSLHDEPHMVAGGQIFVSGEIPRVVTWEEGLFGAVRWVGKDDERKESAYGTAGEATGDGKWVKEDHIMDERYAAIDVKGRGLIIFSARSHAGICNVITDAVKSLNRPIYMIIGGLHLAPTMSPKADIETPPGGDFHVFPRENGLPVQIYGWEFIPDVKYTDQVYRIAPTVEFISNSLQPAPKYVVPMHCSGFKAKIALKKEFGEGCVPAGAGMKPNLEDDSLLSLEIEQVQVQGDEEGEKTLRTPEIRETKWEPKA
ncbi:hypothetical protein FRC00_007689 [Tulasnella sp. 408]|nr:hypothetical protein FRC00_007689 [Tulasnella sp. 408]